MAEVYDEELKDSVEDEEIPERYPLMPVALIVGAVILIAALAISTLAL